MTWALMEEKQREKQGLRHREEGRAGRLVWHANRPQDLGQQLEVWGWEWKLRGDQRPS